MSPISIRPAVPVDVPLLLSFIRGLAVYEKLEHLLSATEKDLHDSLFGPRPYAEALVAAYEGADCGFTLFFHSYSTFAGKPGIYIEDVFVQPERRGKGVGKALFSAVAGIAAQRGCERLEWAVLDWNEPAIHFYKNIGADIMPDWRRCRLNPDGMLQLAGMS